MGNSYGVKRVRRATELAVILAVGVIVVAVRSGTAEASACRPGHSLFRAKSGAPFCCPPGTTGYYHGYAGIACKRPQGFTKHQARRVCPAGQRLYDAKNGVGFCCPPGTAGYYNGYTGITCRPGAGNMTINTGRTCPRGQRLYTARNGAGFCCPAGTTGYYTGTAGITCRRNVVAHTRPPATGGATTCPAGYGRFKDFYGGGKIHCCPPGTKGGRKNGRFACWGQTASKCPVQTRRTCPRRTSWKCSPFQLADGTRCTKCGCYFN